MQVLITDDLLNDLRKGREEAFNILFNSFFNRLCNFAKSYVISSSIAKNIVQDVFIKVWEKRQTLQNSNSIVSLLLTITKNNCLDYLKHKQIEYKFQKQAIENYAELELNYYSLMRLEIDLLDYDEIVQIVEKTIVTLPPQCQKVFRMSRFDNHSNAEIADKLGIGIKAVEANMTRAIKTLKQELKDYITILIFLNIF